MRLFVVAGNVVGNVRSQMIAAGYEQGPELTFRVLALAGAIYLENGSQSIWICFEAK